MVPPFDADQPAADCTAAVPGGVGVGDGAAVVLADQSAAAAAAVAIPGGVRIGNGAEVAADQPAAARWRRSW